MRVVMCILIISFTVIFGMSCERHMEQQVSYTEADSLNHLAYDIGCLYKELCVYFSFFNGTGGGTTGSQE